MKNDTPTERMTTQASSNEVEDYRALAVLLQSSPIPPGEILANLSLYLTRSSLSQILFMSHLYSKILDVHGTVMEFGNRWGRNLALYSTLRNVFEPHNQPAGSLASTPSGGFRRSRPKTATTPQ